MRQPLPTSAVRIWQWLTEAGAQGATRNAATACRTRVESHAALEVQLAGLRHTPADRELAA